MAVSSAASDPAGRNSVKVGSSYAETRAYLLSNGWHTDDDWGFSGSSPFNQYPEVLCGEGYDAVCTGRFVGVSGALLVTIDQSKKALPVIYIEED